MFTYLYFGLILGIVFVSGIELADYFTDDSSYFRVTYFFKGTLLTLLLAAMSSLYLMYGMVNKRPSQISLCILLFFITLVVISVSFKFLLLGFVVSALSAILTSRQLGSNAYHVHVGINIALLAYVYYVEFINIGNGYEIFM